MTSTTTADPDTPIILKSDVRGRVQLPVERREALLDEFERSGKSGQEFAAWAGVKYPTFAHWRQERRRKLGQSKAAPKELKWLEAVVAEPAAPGASVAIHLSGGVRVEVSSVKLAAELLLALGMRVC